MHGLKADDCDLCEAARITHWFHEDDVCWIAECEICATPMVVWRWHGTEPDSADLAHMHGQLARGYPDVRANTVASFALGDYEWMLAFEADELHRIVDLMRHLRASDARRHVREEVPFYTGRRRTPTELVTDLP